MRLTDYTDYALRILMHLGAHPRELMTTRHIATVLGISHNHLTKIVHQLGQRGILSTARGRGGGVRLALAPEQIMLGAIVRMTEPDFTTVECFSETRNTCTLASSCRLKCLLAEATGAFLDRLDRVALSSMIPAGSSVARLPAPSVLI